MNISILIAEERSDSRAETVYSAFRTIGITELPVTHGDMFAGGVRNETDETWPDIFPIFVPGIGADPVLDIVPVAERQAKPSQASQKKVLTEGEDLREAQVDVSLSVSHSFVWPHCWAQ